MMRRSLRPAERSRANDLQRIERAFRRHDLADEQQHSFIAGDVVTYSEVPDIMVLFEKRRIHAERNDRARADGELVSAHQLELVLGLGNDVIRISHETATGDLVERNAFANSRGSGYRPA